MVRRLGAVDVTKPYKFKRFGAMDVTKPYKFINIGAVDVTKPNKFIRFGAMDVRRPLGVEACEVMFLSAFSKHLTPSPTPPRRAQKCAAPRGGGVKWCALLHAFGLTRPCDRSLLSKFAFKVAGQAPKHLNTQFS